MEGALYICPCINSLSRCVPACAGLLHFRGEGRPPASWGLDPLSWWKAWKPNVTLLAEDWMEENGMRDAFQHHSFEVRPTPDPVPDGFTSCRVDANAWVRGEGHLF